MPTPDESRKRTWRFKLNDTTTLEMLAPRGATEKQVRRRGRVSLVLGTLIAAGVIVAVAFGDNLKNDVVAGGNDTITAGGSTTIDYWIQAIGGNPPSCDAANGSSATVTINVPVGVVATPSSLVFTQCNTSGNEGSPNNTQSVEFSSSTPGDHSITASVSDTSGSYNPAPAAFTLHVNAAPPPSDTTAPVISYVLNPASPDGANGWYKSNVTLTWTVTEDESPGSLVKTGCVDQSITADQQATTYSCSAKSDGGSAGPVDVTIKRDATNPNVSVTGFTDGQIFVKGVDTLPTEGCSRSDATSEIDASGSTGPTITAGGLTVNGVGSVTYTCSARDNAGNLASASATYHVHYGGLSGILQPINADNTSVFNRGKAVPVKFRLAGDEYTGFDFSGWTLKRQQTACSVGGGDVGTVVEPIVENPSNGFRYDADPSADQYIYNANFKDQAVGSCWKVKVILDSGQVLESAIFKLQK